MCILKERFVDHSISLFPDTDSGQVLDMLFETIADYFNECSDSCEPVLPELIFSLCSQIDFFLKWDPVHLCLLMRNTVFILQLYCVQGMDL